MRTTFWTHWVWPILGGKTRAVALPLAIVVGTVLLAVNQGSDLLAGEIDPVMVFRAVASYAIPYVVSSIGYLNAPNSPEHSQGEEVTARMNDEARIQILQVPDCPLVDPLIDQIESCLAVAGIGEPVKIVVGDYPSPTLVMDGVDVATGRPVEGEPRCRLDLPSKGQIRAAVRALHPR